jgi:hypothetical protein
VPNRPPVTSSGLIVPSAPRSAAGGLPARPFLDQILVAYKEPRSLPAQTTPCETEGARGFVLRQASIAFGPAPKGVRQTLTMSMSIRKLGMDRMDQSSRVDNIHIYESPRTAPATNESGRWSRIDLGLAWRLWCGTHFVEYLSCAEVGDPFAKHEDPGRSRTPSTLGLDSKGIRIGDDHDRPRR